MQWQLINLILNEDDGTETRTEAMQLPHGCLVRTRQVGPPAMFGAQDVGIALCFVPGAVVKEDGSVEHRM
jgi:hypothetical protein